MKESEYSEEQRISVEINDSQDEIKHRISRSKAWMLGPKAENQELFEQLLLEAFRDYCYWRKNFHPEDFPYVKAVDRLDPAFQEYVETLHDHLFDMLSRLKLSVPFFSPRYLGHMNTDMLMPGVLGYVAAMLYNQNNIVGEAAVVTMQFETEATQLVARMLGLPGHSWGHLCSGGTSANMEALWVARNLRMFPYQIALALRKGEAVADLASLARLLEELPVKDTPQSFGDVLGQRHLKALHVDQMIALHRTVTQRCGDNLELAKLVEGNSVGQLGLIRFSSECRRHLGDNFPQDFKIILSQNAHYSLRKSAGALGLGEANLVKIPLDPDMRLNTVKLEEAITECHKANECVLAVVGVYGSTEEGSIDDFGRIMEIREECQVKNEGDFWIHGDACYGGYALSLMHPADKDAATNEIPTGEVLSQEMLSLLAASRDDALPDGLVWDAQRSEKWLRPSRALGMCDSIAIDPHKLGYIPYPAGAVLYGDYRVRELIRCDAPYLNAAPPTEDDPHGQDALLGASNLYRDGDSGRADDAREEDDLQSQIWNTPYLGKYTLEGSRPGAYGAAVWLAHKTVPLHRGGHGLIVAQSILGARHLVSALKEAPAADGINCHLLCEDPDLNMLCYTFSAQAGDAPISLAVMNRCVERLYGELLPTKINPTQKRDFVVAMTSLDKEGYGGLLDEILKRFALCGRLIEKKDLKNTGNPWRDDHKINFIRTVVMGPFLLQATTRDRDPRNKDQRVDLAGEYARFLGKQLAAIVNSELNRPIPKDIRPGLRDQVLVLEDDLTTSRALRDQLDREGSPGISYRAANVTCVQTEKKLDKAKALAGRQDMNIKAALIDIELQEIADGGIQFLGWMSQHRAQEFNGAVIFSSHLNAANQGRIAEIKSRHPHWRLTVREKPRLEDDRFQAKANQVMEDLWDILNLPPPSLEGSS